MTTKKPRKQDFQSRGDFPRFFYNCLGLFTIIFGFTNLQRLGFWRRGGRGNLLQLLTDEQLGMMEHPAKYRIRCTYSVTYRPIEVPYLIAYCSRLDLKDPVINWSDRHTPGVFQITRCLKHLPYLRVSISSIYIIQFCRQLQYNISSAI
jgi:hypothetical protein